MNCLIKSAKIIDSQSEFHQQTMDVLIENGIIKTIAPSIANEKGIVEITNDNLHLSIGWIDLRASSKDPGYESKEDLISLSQAAAAGGFTKVCILPNTKPVVQTKEGIAYFKSFSSSQLVDVLPIAAVTKNSEGKDFTEMLDLNHAGAVAFSDGEVPLWNSDIFLKTLQYLYPIGGLLMNRSDEQNLSMFGQMHEGLTSTLLGMKGIPAAAEEIMIQRDLKLLEYFLENQPTNQAFSFPILHFSTISTEKAVQLIREAKKKGLPVSCDVASHQLAFLDEDLTNFDTNLKVFPPFRSKNDVKALKKGLADGTIDAIVSDHQPQDEECKNLEFDLADFGIIGLQTAFSVANQYSNLSVEALVEKLTTSPQHILRQVSEGIKVGASANLTLFSPEKEWIFDEKNNLSKSKNSPFLNQTMKGKVVGVIHKNQLSLTHE